MNITVPNNLKHKPIYLVSDYAKVDGIYAENTDVQGISIGKAQWSTDNNFIPSIKIWRHSGKRWSRQSEETTLTRAIDMATFIIKVLNIAYNNCDNIFSIEGKSFNIKYINNKEDFISFISDRKNKKMLNKHIISLSKELNEYFDNLSQGGKD